MKRWLMTILLFLLLGAAVNVAVAWTIAVSRGLSKSQWSGATSQRLGAAEVRRRLQHRFDGLETVPDRWLNGSSTRAIGCEHVWLSRGGRVGIKGEVWLGYEWSFGLPLLALAGEEAGAPWPESDNFSSFLILRGERDEVFRVGHQVGLRSHAPVRVPLRPLWFGFSVNTLFYGTLLWVITCGPWRLRRHLRCTRGHCPKCGYPAGTSEVCTECGTRFPADVRIVTAPTR